MNNYEKLENLLVDKNFNELSPKQQTWVQSFMSIEEYNAQRRVLIESKSILKEKSVLPVGDLASLQSKFKDQHRISFSSYLSQPIASYQAFLLAAVVGVIVWWLRPTIIETKIETNTEIVYKTKVDTVFQEKIIYQEKVIYKTKKEVISVPTTVTDTVYMPFANKEFFYKEKEDKNDLNKEKPKGKSMKDMGDLLDFVVKVY